MMRFTTASISRTGGRDQNQDFCGTKEAGSNGIWVVADGLGGHLGGEIAAEVAVNAILAAWHGEDHPDPSTVQTLILTAQAAIIAQQQADAQLASMRTTLVVMVRSAEQLLWGHVGDSRLYHFRDGAIAFQTKDHSVPQTLVHAGELTMEQIRTHPDRNRILRAVGNPDGVKPTTLDTACQVRQSDAFLLCTDGFWEYVTETEMVVDLAKSVSPGEWLGRMELRLLGKAAPGNDNYTAMAVFVA